MAEPAARFRIQAVADATGINAATLRAWERRYGLPRPTRGDSGYRLYSDEDIVLVRRMVELNNRGIAPSEAAAMVLRGAADEPPMPLAHETDAYGQAVEQLLAAAAMVDQAALERALYAAMGLGSAWTVYCRVLSPMLSALGAAWEQGRLTVGHEHFASQAVGTALRSLLRLSERHDAVRTLVLACVDEEQHDLPLYGVALLAASVGWRPIVLGPRTPAPALATALRLTRPALVGLSITSAVPAAPLDFFGAYARVCGSTRWVVGGSAACRHRAAIESVGGQCFEGSAEALRGLLEAH